MKKLSILLVLFGLISCEKEEIKTKGQVKYYLNGYTEYNTKLEGIKYNTDTKYIQYNFKINDSTNGVFILSTEKEIQYCHSNIITEHSNGIVKQQIVDYKMKGRYYLTNNVVNGMFTSTGFNYIEFTNYHL